MNAKVRTRVPSWSPIWCYSVIISRIASKVILDSCYNLAGMSQWFHHPLTLLPPVDCELEGSAWYYYDWYTSLSLRRSSRALLRYRFSKSSLCSSSLAWATRLSMIAFGTMSIIVLLTMLKYEEISNSGYQPTASSAGCTYHFGFDSFTFGKCSWRLQYRGWRFHCSKLLFVLGGKETAKESTLVWHIVKRLGSGSILLEGGGKGLASLWIHLNCFGWLIFLVYDCHGLVSTEEVRMPGIDISSLGPINISEKFSNIARPNEILDELICGSHGFLEKRDDNLVELFFQ